MKDLYHNKYLVLSARAEWWNYDANAAYFITICTKNRVCYFGNVLDGEMVLNEVGRVAFACWQDIPIHFPFVKIDAFIIMPNHVHGIIVIDKNDQPDDTDTVETQDFASQNIQETQNLASLHDDGRSKNKFGPQSKNLASIVRGFKAGVTMQAHEVVPDFGWQPRYHDHIIKDEKSYNNITHYIITNALNWRNDGLFTE